MVGNRIIGLIFCLLFIPFIALAQNKAPIQWKAEAKQISDNTFELNTIATMDEGWHVYSSKHGEGSDGIGIPTGFTWEESADYTLVGDLKEKGKLLDVFNELIEVREQYFAKKVTFIQKVEVQKPTTIKTEVMFQVCNEEGCLAPDYKTLEFKVTPTTPEKAAAEPEKPKEEDQNQLVEETSTEDSVQENIAQNQDNVAIDSTNVTQTPVLIAPDLDNENNNASASVSKDKSEPKDTTNDKKDPKKKSFWDVFIAGFLGGLAALIMPCMYPMIPLTVSLFTKQSKNKAQGIRKAIIYGLSIIFIFVLLGLLITILFGGGALNAFATNPWLNIFLFVIFIIFAISFFGAFEITLPSKWINQADKQADKGGLIGIFFMALVLVLVSFSCTGPIIGISLGAISQSGEYFAPTIAMFAFALAVAIPFTLFAMFPGWLNSMPKSGGWLNTVKVFLGFLELAFAFKFLSNADLVWQAHWLERETFLAIWIGIFFLAGLYLLNMFRLSHDSETKHIGWPRLLFAILTFVFVFYMLPGLWGAPLKILSGLTPPKNYAESPTGFFGTALTTNAKPLPEHAHAGPHQIPAFHDLEHAFAYAEKVGKPVMIDFTGDACANCRKVEDNVWSDPRVKEKLTNDVVLASLYVDRMIKLPEEEQVYSEEKGRKLRTIGDKWAAFQIKEFQSNSQPLYIIVDKDLKRYNEPMGAEMDVEDYLTWMKEGIDNFSGE